MTAAAGAPSAVMSRLDQLDNFDKQELMKEKAKLQNMSLKEKRALMIQSDAEKKKDIEEDQKKAAKDLGASRDTIHTIGNISADGFHFIQLCAEWNSNSSNIRRSKVAYERLVLSEKLTFSQIMEEAWRHRPLGCDTLRKALEIRSKYYLALGQTKGTDTKLPRDLKPMFKLAANKKQKKGGGGGGGGGGCMTVMTKQDREERISDLQYKDEAGTITDTEKKELLKLDPPVYTIQNQLDACVNAINKIDEQKAESRLDSYFPGHGGFREQQAASMKLRELERRAGGPLDYREKIRRFPCLADGWSKCPKRMAMFERNKKLGFELEIEARDRRDRDGRESPSIIKAKAVDEALAAASRNEKARAKAPTPEAGGYEGANAETFSKLFDDDDGSVDGLSDDEIFMDKPLPSMSASEHSSEPVEEGVSDDEQDHDDGAGVMPKSKQGGLSNMQMDSIWHQASGAAGGFNQAGDSDSESVADMPTGDAYEKKRKLEVEGGVDSDAEYDEEGEQQFYDY